ncbi:hypothetical protein GCM10022247_04350 [Allokutzneria multivorans]|uniref:Pvc16 N-terminal domain-containing protein n=1 Tax=Allokutzneria multivorans TaxID=1142134 RepID=A0ABP7QWI3_9PSEU
MITDIDAALRAVLESTLGSRARVSLGPPEDASSPVISLLLLGIRAEQGGTDWTDVRDSHGKVVARRQPVRRFRLTYRLCVAASRPEEEHQLLELVLRALASLESLPLPLQAGMPTILSVGVPLEEPGIGIAVVGPLVPDVDSGLSPAVETLDLGSERRPVHTGPIPRRRVHLTEGTHSTTSRAPRLTPPTS